MPLDPVDNKPIVPAIAFFPEVKKSLPERMLVKSNDPVWCLDCPRFEYEFLIHYNLDTHVKTNVEVQNKWNQTYHTITTNKTLLLPC